HFDPDGHQHQAEQAFEPVSGKSRRGGGTEDSAASPADGQPENLIPEDVAASTMCQRAAKGGGDDYAETRAQGGMNCDRRVKTDGWQSPQKKRDENDSATDAEKPGQEAGKHSAGSKKNQGFRRKQVHRQQRKKPAHKDWLRMG
ncbi:MAG TPA: hypothetical protein VJ955_08210, partial [Desulfuromonadales bacterium]|nr:hypothetical protein [Desulfuromonadales bacterium]